MSADRECGGAGDRAAEALAAANAIVDDFGHHRRDAYFERFAADATFVFHTHPVRLESRADYERLWHQWETHDGFRVYACASVHQRVQLLGDVAVFTHTVETDATFGGQRATVTERETIVLSDREREGTWVAVHEHLSPLGAADG